MPEACCFLGRVCAWGLPCLGEIAAGAGKVFIRQAATVLLGQLQLNRWTC